MSRSLTKHPASPPATHKSLEALAPLAHLGNLDSLPAILTALDTAATAVDHLDNNLADRLSDAILTAAGRINEGLWAVANAVDRLGRHDPSDPPLTPDTKRT